ncbi:MAG: NUDIX hydrolase [Acetobacteraceae bacterium]
MAPEELRRRLHRVAASARPGAVIRGTWPLPATATPPVPAAVLVGLRPGAEPGVLLTRRTERLAHHAGQVSFPGGRIDPGDAGPTAAALRETEEEVGLAADRIVTFGPLEDFLTGTGFRITPILALLPERAEYRPQPAEVAAVFHYPLARLLDPAAPWQERQWRNGQLRDTWVWPHPDHVIWGATAAILVHLAERLRAA